MKKITLTLTILLSFVIATGDVVGQTKDERKAAIKELKKRAPKYARKEAKKLRKQGFSNLPGELPMEKQLEESYVFINAKDDQGTKKYYTTTQLSKAETFAAAKQQSMQLCLNDIASQIGSNILGKIKSNVANAEGVKDANSVTEVIGGYQNRVAARLGRTNPVTLFKRVDKKTKLTHVTMTVAYDILAAEKIVKKDLRKKLKEDLNLVQDEIDEILSN